MQSDELEVPTYYWDACLFLTLIGREPGHEVLSAILENADRGSLQVCTSIISIAEVAGAGMPRSRVSDEAIARIEKLWASGSPIRLVELGRSIAFEARELIRAAFAHRQSLRANDALHLATAKSERVTAFHTLDNKLLGKGPLTGLTVSKPTLPDFLVK